MDGTGQPVRLLGVNRSGTQYMCTEGPNVFDGPTDDHAVAAMVAWRITAVRISLNEQCWLGINGLPVAYPAAVYRRAITDYVDRLIRAGLYVVLDLHWNAAGTAQARSQQPMADRDHAGAFWTSVAATFKDRTAVLFDLYNEPYPDHDSDSEAAWQCVREGGVCPGVDFVAAGMQELVDAVRSTGAQNPLLVSGPQHAGTLTEWLAHRPHDPLQQVAATIHIYGPPPDASPCWTATCWVDMLEPLARDVPVVIGEMGNTDCTPTVVAPLMTWADRAGVSYLAWSWVTSSCAVEPALISGYEGTPTPYGVGVRDHLRSR
ncbi:glycoside hydrolase family 5 protein [Pseudonocardia lutea]|uniref:Glycoside hydrolase family 5 protein n=1 Tax=Pseudonocardia lutea TaxID=2172015 RepID=A0ABW1IIC0_9PSEU